MWFHSIIFLILINFSEEKCQKIKKTITTLGRFQTPFTTKHYTYISCSDIQPNFNLHDGITNSSDASTDTVYVTQSNMPELTQEMLQNINISEIIIQANIEIIQHNAFQKCNISTIDLDDNDIKLIKDMGFNSPSIQILSLQNNSLAKIKSNDFYGLYNLKKLNLQSNHIDDIDEDSFAHLANVTELDLSFNKLWELHLGLFKNMTNLETIHLNDNVLQALGDKIFTECKSLEYLNIENNDITIIDARLYPNSLLSINASYNQLMSVDFFNLINVDTVDISGNKLTTIDDSLNNMTSLKFLSLNYNSLGPFTDAKVLGHLKNLTTIDLDGNNLQSIDYELFDTLPLLRGISLAVNNFSSLAFASFKDHLLSLNLSQNHLKQLNGLSVMTGLKTLDLSYNNIQEITYDTFENMTDLTELMLQYNSIATLHLGCFRDLRSLRQLNLGHNQITTVETGAFTGLKLLSKLDISYNNLSNLDENVFHSTKQLTSLNIAYNNLKNTEVKRILAHLSWFRELTLEGNNWTCKALADLTKRSTYALLTRGTSYNVTNVFGIPCNNTEDGEKLGSVMVNAVTTYMGFIQDRAKDMSYKMTVNNVVLIMLLIFAVLKFNSLKCFSCYTAAKQFFYRRYQNEQELQLI